jgi:TRAP-type uncharacterized transport system fused permease subunit
MRNDLRHTILFSIRPVPGEVKKETSLVCGSRDITPVCKAAAFATVTVRVITGTGLGQNRWQSPLTAQAVSQGPVSGYRWQRLDP